MIPGFKFPARQRLTEKKPLGVIASQADQGLQVLAVFDPLGNHLKTQIMTQLNDRPNNALTPVIGGHAAHQALIDLQLIDVECVEVGERGVSGPEVVDLDPNPHLVNLIQGDSRSFGLGD